MRTVCDAVLPHRCSPRRVARVGHPDLPIEVIRVIEYVIMSEAEAAAPVAASPKKSKSAAAKKPRVKPAHPKTADMVNSAIKNLKERGGSSLQAIKKYISANYKVDAEKLSPFIKKYLKGAVGSGKLVQTKGKGASGSFKLASKDKVEKSAVKKVKKPAAAKKPKAAGEKKPKPAKKPAVKKAAAAKKPAGEKKVKPAGEKKPKAAAPKKAKSPSKAKKATKSPAAKKPKAPKPKKAAAKPKAAPKKK